MLATWVKLRQWGIRFFPYFVITIFSLVALKSLATPGLFTAHDSEAHVTRILQFHSALKSGQFPPRWAADYFNGLGSPVMMLNYQLPYYLAEIFIVAGFTVVTTYKLTLVASYILSGFFAYKAFKSMGTSISALVGSILYLWAPYRFVDIYVRGALGESFSFMFPPLILWAVHKRSWLAASLAMAGLFLSHPVASAFYMAVFLGYVIVQSVSETQNWRTIFENVTAFLMSFCVAVAIAAFNLVPTLLLTKYTQYTPQDSHPLDHFPTIQQLLSAKWGYGFSVTGPGDTMSFRIGYAQVLAVGVAAVALLYFCSRLSRTKWSRQLQFLPALYMLGVGVVVFGLLLKSSTPLWNVTGLISIIDFPWRLLMIEVFVSAYLANWVVRVLPARFGLFLALTLLFVNIRANIHHVHINTTWPWSVQYYQQNPGTGDAFGEYASKWRSVRTGTTFPSRIQIIDGHGELQLNRSIPQLVTATVEVAQPALVRFNVMYFPGWQVWIDGERQQLPGERCVITKDSSLELDHNASGLIACRIEAGRHSLKAVYATPLPLLLGNVISSCGIVSWLWIWYRSSSLHLTNRRIFSRLLKR